MTKIMLTTDSCVECIWFQCGACCHSLTKGVVIPEDKWNEIQSWCPLKEYYE